MLPTEFVILTLIDMNNDCKLAPDGWRCSREAGHEGPCAAWPDTIWLKIVWAWRMRSLSILLGRHV
jgi:hypothetical protein